MTTPRWILGHDASCTSCVALAHAVHQESSGRVESHSLTEPAIVELRTRAFRGDPPWEPTLLRVRGDRVQAWTGRRLPFRLALVLGVSRSWRTLAAVGRLRAGGDVGTRNRLSQVMAGGRVVIEMIRTGAVPPLAGAADRWVAEHRDRLPLSYEDLEQLPLEIRRAVFRAAAPAERSAWWSRHLELYSADHDATLDDAQRAGLQRAQQLVEDPAVFEDGDPDAALHQRLLAVTTELETAFGSSAATAILAVLGRQQAPEGEDDPSKAAVCGCATASDWCSSPTRCRSGGCTQQSGCGAFWAYTCNGRCA